MQYEEAISEYLWVKENIKYYFPYWGDATRTLAERRGHCGMKAELLISRLRARGLKARYVEGRPSERKLPIVKIGPFSVHFWVEAKVDGKWLTLDPTPDSSILRLSGDTEPGTHLGNPTYITRWDEIPPWYKEGYNHPLIAPLRWVSNLKLVYHRKMSNYKSSLKIQSIGQT
jgi:transglutaminase-like putative cysteine protease